MTWTPDRRTVLGAAGAALLTPASVGWAKVGATAAADPFTLGVASGFPSADGMVLWTRLAPEPLAASGLGRGLAGAPAVAWELAADEGFRRVLRRGAAVADPRFA